MDRNETGLIMVVIGGSLFILGLIVLLDRALMMVGDLIVTVGILMLLKNKLFTLFHSDKIFGTIFVLLGILAFIFKYLFLGFILKLIGCLYIFKKSIPTLKAFLIQFLLRKISRIIRK